MMNDRDFLAALPDRVAKRAADDFAEEWCPGAFGLGPSAFSEDCLVAKAYTPLNQVIAKCRLCWEQALKTETAPSDGAAPATSASNRP